MEKIIILSIIIILVIILVGGGLFYWWQREKVQKPSKKIEEEGTPSEKEEKVIESFGDIIVKETPEGKIVENKKEGISMKVPEGWEVQLPTNEQEPISFYSPETVQGEQGEEYMCKITSSIENRTISIETLKTELESDVNEWYTVEFNNYEVIEVGKYQSLKNTFQAAETGYSIAVYVPTTDKLYSFVVYATPQDKEKCSQEFEKFLETVSIE